MNKYPERYDFIMKNFSIGFIGMGNMAKAIALGWVEKNVVEKSQLFAFAPTREKLLNNAKEIGFTPADSVEELVQKSDMIIMACKPYQIESVLEKVGAYMSGKTLISIAAGWNFDKFNSLLENVQIQCIMPNTPAMVGEGVFLFEDQNSLAPQDLSDLKNMFSSLGVVVELPTRLMGIGMSISGCGPAFMDLMMEAYADAAVKYGIQRPLAYKMIAQTMLGSAKLQLETGKHPGVLKDEVCSPNGTTIRGVTALEEYGFRNACIQSVDAIMKSLG